MSSRTNPPKPNVSKGKRALQRMRREASFRSAKDFAECGIPLPSAWAIADELGCSIDLVVGREDIDAAADSIQGRVEALSRTGREMHDDYLRFLEFREEANASQDWS